ncbi:hypothetical protein L204_102525 [Cryptococcus depauperatus]
MLRKSLLSVVLQADNFPNYSLPPLPPPHPYIPFHLTRSDLDAGLVPLGLLRPDVVDKMRSYNDRPAHQGRGVWEFVGKEPNQQAGVCFIPEIVEQGKAELDRVMRLCVESWREEGIFARPLAGWRNELYTVYASPDSSGLQQSAKQKPFGNVAFDLERAACAIFGIATFGVHLIAYEGTGDNTRLWVPRRSKTKATWPGFLDNSVAGGIPAGMKPLEAIIKECDEEASLPEQLVKKVIKNVGAASYVYITSDGFLQPETEFLYDLPLPDQSSSEYVRPAPHDDEVDSFASLTVPQLIEALHSGEMKPNCGLIYVDWLMRHGYVTPENETDYLEISTRIRRRLGVALPVT